MILVIIMLFRHLSPCSTQIEIWDWDTITLLRLMPGDLLSPCPHRQFHTQPGLLDRWAAMPNSYPNTCVPSTEAVCIIF